MAGRRLANAPPAPPLTFFLDGEKVSARSGETVAAALLANDKIAWARSPKLHRPRGAACHRGGCDGCLARIDGVPNLPACLVPAREGMRVESQNVLGTRTIDLLRVTDWFFPQGIDHHHLFAGVPGVSTVMQTIARRVAGLGELPERARPITPAVRTEAFAVVVGSGASGRAVAQALGRADRRVVLVDDAPTLGGSARALGAALEPVSEHVEVRVATTAGGVFDGDVLLVSDDRAEIVKPLVLVLATGVHDGIALFGNNDLPGVYSARAAALLAHGGVAVGERVVIAGEGPYADAVHRLLGGERVSVDDLVAVEGSSRVGAVFVRRGGVETKLRADALVVDFPGAPSFELAEQAGAALELRAHGYGPRDLGNGNIAPGVFMTGELRGVPANIAALEADGRLVAAAVEASILE